MLPTVDPACTADPLDSGPVREVFALCIAWDVHEPQRCGEVFLLPPSPEAVVIGRAHGQTPHGAALSPVRQRPGRNQGCSPLTSPSLSRHQLQIRVHSDHIQVDNIGRCPALVQGRPASSARMVAGDVLILRSTMVLVLLRRPEVFVEAVAFPRRRWPAFGAPDGLGVVGESPAAWAIREQAAFAAGREAHVLVHGESGTGKELVARAVHALSARGAADLVARNAATIPEGLVAAELFGNARNYPNPGMDARPGLIGGAHGSSLLLDEIGEVSEQVQAQLLRVLDSSGEYSRLGEEKMRRADFRLIAATNRSLKQLKPDLLARLPLRLRTTPLRQRIEDVPLLLWHLLRKLAEQDPTVTAPILDECGAPRISTQLIAALLLHRYPLNVRELSALLWTALLSRQSDRLELSAAVRSELAGADPAPAAQARPPGRKPGDLSPEEIQAALDANGGVLETTWRALGLKNRFQLIRLVKKHNLTTRKHSGS